jgi:FAD binding domain
MSTYFYFHISQLHLHVCCHPTRDHQKLTSLTRFFLLQGAVLLPKTASTVSVFLRYASQETLDLAVHGGGHSTAGTSSTQGGLVINLSSMRTVTVDPVTKILTIQGGALWSDVDDAAWEHGLATVGGTVADTGVGGLTLGGGYGWLSGTHGLVVDNLISCEVVLGSGDVVRASKDENADLFWGLKGAGQNFGVVTEFVIQAWNQGNVWAGTLVFPTEKLQEVVDVLNDIMPEMKGRGACVLGFGRPPPAPGQVVVLVPVVYDGTEKAGLVAFKRLLDLQPFHNTATSVPYNTVGRMLHIPQGKRVSMKGASFTLPLRFDFVKSTMDAYATFTEDLPDSGASLLMYEIIDPSKICEVGNQETAFANRGWHMNAMVGPLWESEVYDVRARAWAREVAEMFKVELQRSKGKENGDGVMVYGNYDRKYRLFFLVLAVTSWIFAFFFLFSLSFLPTFWKADPNAFLGRIRREIPRHLWYQLSAVAGTEGTVRSTEHVQ